MVGGLLGELFAAFTAWPVVQHHRQAGRELLRFPLPVVDHRGRADQQVGLFVALLMVPQNGGQRLDRLAQSHVVGQAGAETPPAEKIEPRVAQLLVGAEFAVEFLRRVQQLDFALLLEGLQQIVEPAGGGEGDVVGFRLLVGAQPDADDFPQGGLVAVAPEVGGGANFVGVDFDPLAAEADQRHLQVGQFEQFLGFNHLVAHGDLDVQVDEGRHGHVGAALHGRSADLGPNAWDGSSFPVGSTRKAA